MDSSRASCIDCGYPLDGLGEPRCPECGRVFDPADEATFRGEMEPLVRIRVTHDPTEARMLRQFLVDQGVRAVVMGDSLATHAGLGSPAAPASVWVGAHDVERASELLAAPGSEDDAPWTCPACGEESDGHFGACWNCGSERPPEDPE